MRVKPGHSLIELLVALGLGALVIWLGAMIGFRHQRFHRDIVVAVYRSEQLDQLVALMPISLRGIAPGEGDIAPGAARDTSLEFRATIATAAICDSATRTMLLAPLAQSPRLSSVLTRPEPGDTAWILETSGPGEVWTPRPITSVRDSTGICRIGGSLPFGVARPALAIGLAEPPPTEASVVRVTRPWRYSLYRGADGAWYLGAKEWNPALGRFNTIQPVAGSLPSASAGGLRFRYLDSAGALVGNALTHPRGIAGIEVAIRVDSAIPGRYAHAASVRNRGSAVVALRNRAR